MGLIEAKLPDAQSISFAVPATSAKPILARWQADPVPVPPATQCDDPYADDALELNVTDNSGHEAGPLIAAALRAYAGGITTGDYDTAYAVLSPAAQLRTSRATFDRGVASSLYDDVRIGRVETSGDTLTTRVSFTTYQDADAGSQGQTCSRWQIDYEMIPQDRPGLLIDRASPVGPPTPC